MLCSNQLSYITIQRGYYPSFVKKVNRLRLYYLKLGAMKRLNVALTGGIACGKSRFGGFLEGLGAQVIRLDDLSAEVTGAGSSGLAALVEAFGVRVVNRAGGLNRAVLRDILLACQADRRVIEGILHPRILAEMRRLQQHSQKRVVVVEVPLLFEQGLEGLFDRVVVVVCGGGKQRERLRKRTGVDEYTAQRLIAMQMNQRQRLRATERVGGSVVKNNGGIEDLQHQAQAFYKGLG